MKAKAILLGAILAAATTASQAQTTPVYSINVVGYHKLVVPPGFSMIANQLVGLTNTVASLLPAPPLGTTLYKFSTNTLTFSINTFGFAGWGNPNQILLPGEGAFILNPSSTTSFTNVFSGDVQVGTTTNLITPGFSVISSMLPQSGPLDGNPTTGGLGFPAVLGDIVYVFNPATQTYQTFSYSFNGFGGNPPVPAVGQSFWVLKTGSANWVRTFSVQ